MEEVESIKELSHRRKSGVTFRKPKAEWTSADPTTKNTKGSYLLSPKLKSLTTKNHIDILINGKEYFPSAISSMENAKRFIYMDFYRINPDATGKIIGELLCKKAEEGVEVCVIYDHIGSFNSREYFKWLEGAGVLTATFNPVRFLRSKLGINRRDHRKMIIVDGKIGYLGGLNIAEEYGSPLKNWDGWRDTGVKIQGPVVKQMTQLFVKWWNRLSKQPLRKALKTGGESGKEEIPGKMLASVVGTDSLRARREIIRSYRKALWNAKKSIYIQSAYFIPTFSIRRALRQASLRGVDVKIIVPLSGDIQMANFASRRNFKQFMKDSVQIYQYPGPVMHAKTAVIDGIWATVGSFNLNHRSFFHDIEINLLVIDEEFGGKMEECFKRDLIKSLPVDPKKWEERPLNEKFLEVVCYTFKHWL